VPGRTTIERVGKVIWETPQTSAQRWMCHSLATLEHHHFKHARHRDAGDVHIHFFGADMFSFKDRPRFQDRGVVQISVSGFGRTLRNPIRIDRSKQGILVVEPL